MVSKLSYPHIRILRKILRYVKKKVSKSEAKRRFYAAIQNAGQKKIAPRLVHPQEGVLDDATFEPARNVKGAIVGRIANAMLLCCFVTTKVTVKMNAHLKRNRMSAVIAGTDGDLSD